MSLDRLERWTLVLVLGTIIVSGLATLVGCGNETVGKHAEPWAPPGATALKNLGEGWSIWTIEDQCFMSSSLGFNHGVLTKVDCPKDSAK